jgi:hypothetical protein
MSNVIVAERGLPGQEQASSNFPLNTFQTIDAVAELTLAISPIVSIAVQVRPDKVPRVEILFVYRIDGSND